MNHITKELCKNALEMRTNHLSTENIELIKMHVLDYYAAAFAGYRINKDFNRINEEIFFEAGGKAESSVLFTNEKLPAFHAAYMNALYAHGADMDDGSSKAAGHISTHVIPAVLAVAETVKCSWEDVFIAVNTGYDFFNVLAGKAQPSLYRKGFHSTGVAGGIACAAACAQILKLNETQMYNAVSLAVVQAGGLIIIDESGQECKPINPANAARIGVLCALMAFKGLNAPQNPLESKKGWFNAFSDVKEPDVNEIEQYTIKDCYIKLYPTCRHTHSCIEAAIAIHDRIKNGEKIQRIDINIYGNAIRSAGTIVSPKNSEEAKFSIAYATSIALLSGMFTLGDISSIDHSEEVTELEQKINLISDEKTIDSTGTIRGCRMTVITDKGKEYTETVLYPKGERDKKLTWKELEQKIFECADDVVDNKTVAYVIKKIVNLKLKEDFKAINVVLEMNKDEQHG